MKADCSISRKRRCGSELRIKLMAARLLASAENPQAVSFSAPTGRGKAIVMTALFEHIFFGEPGFEAQPDAAILWVSDMPELHESSGRNWCLSLG